jgi:hypothetical protein
MLPETVEPAGGLVIARVGGAVSGGDPTGLKVAPTEWAVFMVTEQVPVPGHVVVEPSTVQPVKLEPVLAVAVKTTTSPPS